MKESKSILECVMLLLLCSEFVNKLIKIIKEQIYSITDPTIMLESLRTTSLNFTYTSFERLIKKAFNLRLVQT